MNVRTALASALSRLRRTGGTSGGLVAPVRLDRRTTDLARRLRPGDIAVIDHVDLDHASAEALVAAGAAAVCNTAASISGRYPNLGPRVLVRAGVPLVDGLDPAVFARVSDGEVLRLDGDALYRGDTRIAGGTVHDAASVEAAMAEARAGLSAQLEAFAAGTGEFLRREGELLIDGVGVPRVATRLAGRHVLVVARGPHHREDLAALRPYIHEYHPVLVGVDGGADVLLAAGYRPALVVGDLDTVSDATLGCGAELVARADRDGRDGGTDRVRELGREAIVFRTSGTAEDAALLLADAMGARLIVTAGSHATLAEFVDRGRTDTASAFLTRLRVGGRLVDAAAVARMHRGRISPWSLLALVAAALLTLYVAAASTPAAPLYLDILAAQWDALRNAMTGWLP